MAVTERRRSVIVIVVDPERCQEKWKPLFRFGSATTRKRYRQ
ncbi:hypothetical protein KKY_1511 [Pelagibacterium halotolerans B2]|uniref:Uncharacterized protein n=1 Tax=Pelagibacterium halotolerans (strain DSM 22347 / JCM 15775 / CGMCC 1.7692 / B2) TaxID=1082931 RepID=G4RAH9_PELHB|nr:hypothetical protein KKY_1511 [Pelagibacterium halotolerans B2]